MINVVIHCGKYCNDYFKMCWERLRWRIECCLVAQNMLQGCFRMDPSERPSCAQLIEHAYFESRVLDNYEQLLGEHSRRMRAEKHKMNRQKNQRARVSQVRFMQWTLFFEPLQQFALTVNVANAGGPSFYWADTVKRLGQIVEKTSGYAPMKILELGAM